VQAVDTKAVGLELRLKDAEAKLKSDENNKAALNADLDHLKATIHNRELKKVTEPEARTARVSTKARIEEEPVVEVDTVPAEVNEAVSEIM
jgi:multidrug resistance efflux pump